MLGEIFRFEWRQQWRAPLFWIMALAFGALAFAVACTDAVMIGGASGNVLRNAPMVIVRLITAFTIFGMLAGGVFVAGAALRDFDNDTAELMFATPVGRGAYLGGRLAAGYAAAVAIMLAVALGVALGGAMPWIDPARLGPADWQGYAWAFGVMVLPDMLFVAALLFLLATVTRSLLATYIGVIAFLVLLSLSGLLTRDVNHHVLAAMLDPFGGRTLGIVTRYWSADELNRRLPPLEGLLLWNRLLWLGVSALLAGAAFALFRTNREGLRLSRRKPRAEPPLLRPVAGAPRIRLPAVRMAYDLRARLAQLRALLAFDLGQVLRGVPFLVMLAFGLVNLLFALAFAGEIYGTATYPVTHSVLATVQGSFHWLLAIIVTFYAGELVWRERDRHTAEVVDAFPLPDWLPLAARLLALVAVALGYLAVGDLVGIAWQLAHGYTRLEPGLYLATLGLDAAPFVLLAVLMLLFQTLAGSKFMGYLLGIVWLVASIIGFPLLHWDHNLFIYGHAPSVPYSDMNGFGHFLAGALWFDLYWGFAAAALLVVASLFSVRGTGQAGRERLHEARARLRRPAAIALGVALTGFVLTGAWIFYNTNVLNHYESSEQAQRKRADYEKAYARYKDLPQPRISAVNTAVDIYPYQRRLEIRGHYTLVNRTSGPIDALHVNFDTDLAVKSLRFAPHETVSDDKRLGYAIYRLKTPLAPGASMAFDFDLEYTPRGFTNEPSGQFLVANGSFFDSGMLPHFGYQSDAQLTDRSDRRKYGLPPHVPRMPRLGDARALGNNYVSNDADWIEFSTTVSTSADQTALAPGYLTKSWTANGRRYFTYTMDRPMLDFYSWLSARYAVKKDSYQGIAIEVYYDPAHAWNVERMIEAVKDSLAYYQAHFTPYQYRQVRILEFPNYRTFAQSFANTIPYSESLGFIADLRDRSKIDYVYYVTAHEVAHQWWAHQVIGAHMQGSTMLSESLAQYSALMVMKHKYGADQMRKFLKYELDKYLMSRATEKVAEEPLAKVENQQYIHYNKGSLVFYALQDYVGEANLDRLLRQFLLAWQFRGPPYPSSQDFMDTLARGLGAKWKGLLDDLFWKITLFDNRISEAAASRLPDGRYQVTLKVHAGKVHVDGTGRETPAETDVPVDIGVFAASPGKGRDGEPLYLEKRLLPAGDSTITVIVKDKPAEAGIDPFNELIDRVSGDNRRPVVMQ
ncbi:M1 family aminopeptidase [Frateuria hangzhouensis]|uniref:M1 family aminopeptidase n=1 Tax=Frateuria hangzhouensis TaxID=2995589 RepID=UPI002260FB34|nr:M1 family aminopeptidase [Frateuria sp. STR12]MCX7512783.1 M1 family aminopeptidase [Frateuria sp. STR12]